MDKPEKKKYNQYSQTDCMKTDSWNRCCDEWEAYHKETVAEIIKVYQDNEDYFPFDIMPEVRPYIDMWKAIKAVAERFIEKGERN